MSDLQTKDELSDETFEAFKLVSGELGSRSRFSRTGLAKQFDFFKKLYKPSDELKKLINRYYTPSKTLTTKQKGELLEEVVFLAFKCLEGVKDISSFTSFDSQLDLVVTGTAINEWEVLCKILGLPIDKSKKIIVEAKNHKKKIDSSIFSRLCFILDHRHTEQCSLGIIFSTSGASGFPKRGGNQTSLKSARATQVLFHARSNKYVVVFDKEDIRDLAKDGALIEILNTKIEDVENVFGNTLKHDFDLNDIGNRSSLPPHLRKFDKPESSP